MKKLIGIIIAVFLIIANIFYLRIGTHDYTVQKLIILNIGIIVTNFLFWSFLYFGIRQRNFMILFFLLFLFLVDLDRMNVQIFLKYNDRLIGDFVFSSVIGGIRLLYLFFSIYIFFFISSTKKFLLRLIGFFNIIVAILIFIEFEGNFTPILRIVIACIYIISLIFFSKNKVLDMKKDNDSKEEQNETKDIQETNSTS